MSDLLDTTMRLLKTRILPHGPENVAAFFVLLDAIAEGTVTGEEEMRRHMQFLVDGDWRAFETSLAALAAGAGADW
ncbi:hypothetical protein [Actinocorallia longicatena]|uniref:Uncharacterized protein n=1 Tax=Actinocorallia longicatena TaxID=111803 RepID=A0ABP6QC91_9ACTN